MRAAPLTAVNAGISRLRLKGGARADSLYDFTNGYVTEDGSIAPRPGTSRKATLPSTTFGLCAFNGNIYVFSKVVQTLSAPFVNLVVAHPTDNTQTITKVHFAQPFLGFIYAVIEWSDGNIYHYWMRSSGTWAASTVYKVGDVIEPTTPNGLAYQASRIGSANPPWTPSTPHNTNTQNATATSASPCVFTAATTALTNGTLVFLGGTAVPTGFTAGTLYYVVGASGFTFKLATTLNGTAINSSSTGTAVTVSAPDIVEPTTYNGFEYVATFTAGAQPHSGTTEPSWPITTGATINEDADATLTGAPTITPNPTNVVPTSVSTRYGSGIGATP
jgi:hypothetical protein